MKDLKSAIKNYKEFKPHGYPFGTINKMKPYVEISFRLFCIRGKYNAEGYSNISSLLNLCYSHEDYKMDDWLTFLRSEDLGMLTEALDYFKTIHEIAKVHKYLMSIPFHLKEKMTL